MKHRTFIGPKGARQKALCGHPIGGGHVIGGFSHDVDCPECKEIQNVHGWERGARPAKIDDRRSGERE